jgi:hypothetical protein
MTRTLEHCFVAMEPENLCELARDGGVSDTENVD